MAAQTCSAHKNSEDSEARLHYYRLPDFARKEEKLDFLSENSLSTVDWRRLVPNQKHTWLRTDTEDEFASYVPIGSKEAKRAKPDNAKTIFKTYSGGVKTNRDVYVYDFQFDPLAKRMKRFVDDYNSQVDKYKRQNPKPNIDDFVDNDKIAWSRDLKLDLKRGNYANYSPDKVRNSLYRPFAKKQLFFDRVLNEEVYQQPAYFPDVQSEAQNTLLCVGSVGIEKPFYSTLVNCVPNLSFVGFGGACQCFPFYTYDEDGSNRTENITDWALDQFRSHYDDPAISKWDIFYYVYGLLHHPGYRERYALDLKRNLPRIPFAPEATKSPPIAMGGDLEGVGFGPSPAPAANSPTFTSTTNPSTATNSIGTPSVGSRRKARSHKLLRKYNDTLTLHGSTRVKTDKRNSSRCCPDVEGKVDSAEGQLIN